MGYIRGKKAIILTLLILVSLSSLFLISKAVAEAESKNTTSEGIVTEREGVYVRKGPSTKTSIVKSASYRTSFKIYSEYFTSQSSNRKTDIWYETNLGGYIRSDLAKADFTSLNGRTTDYLNGRNGAGLSFPAKHLYGKGAELSIASRAHDANGGLWYKVRQGNGYLYVSADYVTFSGGEKPNSGTTVDQNQNPKPKPTDDNSQGSNSNASNNLDRTQGQVNEKDGVNIRTGISTAYNIVKTVGDKIKFFIESEHFTSTNRNDKSYIWYKTNLGGYMRADLADVAYSSEDKANGTNKDYLNARTGAGLDFGVAHVLNPNSKLDIKLKAYDTKGNLWYKIVYNNKELYVNGEYINLVSTIQEEPETPVKPENPVVPDNPEQPANPVEPNKPKENSKGYVNEPDGVNLRKGPSTSTEIVKTVGNRTPFELINEQFIHATDYSPTNIWLNTSLGGYIRSDLAKIEYVESQGTTTDYLNAREGAGLGFRAVKVYNPRTKLTVVAKALDTSGTLWYKVKDGTGYLYVNGMYIIENNGNNDNGSEPGGGTGTPTPNPMTDEEFEAHLTSQGFPESYKNQLRALHERHPNWIFKSSHVGLDWNTALNKQVMSSNLVYYTHPEGYKDVDKDSYDFNAKRYIGKDGNSFVKASDTAVAYYMDPRNFLNEDGIFMFEDLQFNPEYQSEDIVKKILASTSMPSNASKYFMEAATMNIGGQTYTISPVYMAAKARAEIGNGTFMIDGHSFTYGGKEFKGLYNPFNIGAFDSPDGSAAIKGLVFANGGYYGNNTSYFRPWNTLERAIKGAALFIGEDYIANNQNTMYYERFNVKNSMESVGKHQYMTAVYAPANQAYTVYNGYKSYGIGDSAFVFEVPVYDNMPDSLSNIPGSGDNNKFLDSLEIFANGKKLDLNPVFDRFNETYSVAGIIPYSTEEVLVKATPNSGTTYIYGLGAVKLVEGKNDIIVSTKSASGKTKAYVIYLTRDLRPASMTMSEAGESMNSSPKEDGSNNEAESTETDENISQ